jgi:hypothetical protein
VIDCGRSFTGPPVFFGTTKTAKTTKEEKKKIDHEKHEKHERVAFPATALGVKRL